MDTESMKSQLYEMLAKVDTPEDAKRLVESVKYIPAGNRGLSPSVRACRYGTLPVAEYIERANAETLVVSHCETTRR